MRERLCLNSIQPSPGLFSGSMEGYRRGEVRIEGKELRGKKSRIGFSEIGNTAKLPDTKSGL